MKENIHFLLSYWGLFVCFDPETDHFIQKPLDLADPSLLAGFQLSGMSLQTDVGPHLQFAIEPSSPAGLISLKAKGLFLCSDNHGNVSLSREIADSWETFFLISEKDLARFRFFLSHNWVKADNKALVSSSEIFFTKEFQLRVGADIFDLRQNSSLDLVSREWNSQPQNSEHGFGLCTIWLENWQPVDYYLFRPLVYFCAFGDFSLKLVSISIKSLNFVASQENDVLIITDMNRSVISGALSDCIIDRLHIMHCTAHDFLDFTAARYLISGWTLSNQFQPLLYVDADVVFDLHTRPMLIDLLLSSDLSAQLEPFAPLKIWNAVGAELIQAAGLCVEETTSGFNTGIIGIPYAPPHFRKLRKIFDAIYRYADFAKDRRALSHFDQSVANYISAKTNTFNCALISACVRWYDGEAIIGGNTKMGLVHFWGGGSEKMNTMEAYLEEVRQSIPELPPLASSESPG